MTLAVVRPWPITPAMVDSSVTEDEYPAYDSQDAYAADARVIHGHFVYQSLQANNKGYAPDAYATWWVKVGPTNRMKAFDLSHSTQTQFSGAAWFTIKTGKAVNSLALLAINGLRSVRVRVIDPSFGTVYDKTTVLWTRPEKSGWYPWTYGERRERSNFYALDLPSYRGAEIRLDIEASAAAGIGVILLGQQETIGIGVHLGVRLGIRDYSRKTTNDWGEVELLKRGFARTRSLQVLCENKQLDNIDRLLSGLRATPVLWLIARNMEQPNVYGFYTDYDLGIQYALYSELSINIEGLTES